MIDADKDAEERAADLRQVLHCQRTLIKLSFFKPLPDQLVDGLLEPLRGGIFDCPHRRFDRVGEHHDPCFLRARLGPRIPVVLFLDLIDLGFVGIVARQVHRLRVKIVHPGGAVVHGDEVDHLFREAVLTGERHAVLDVGRNDE